MVRWRGEGERGGLLHQTRWPWQLVVSVAGGLVSMVGKVRYCAAWIALADGRVPCSSSLVGLHRMAGRHRAGVWTVHEDLVCVEPL